VDEIEIIASFARIGLENQGFTARCGTIRRKGAERHVELAFLRDFHRLERIMINTVPLNEKQVDLLRHLYRQTGPVLVDHLDGRVVRALRSRGMVEEKGDWLSLTDAGRAEFEKLRRRRVANPHTVEAGSPRQARAEAIIRAVEALELALPRDAELKVGDMLTYADDVVESLRGFARQLARAG
jgi:DNA-binding MarR family transcriptional regulator